MKRRERPFRELVEKHRPQGKPLGSPGGSSGGSRGRGKVVRPGSTLTEGWFEKHSIGDFRRLRDLQELSSHGDFWEIERAALILGHLKPNTRLSLEEMEELVALHGLAVGKDRVERSSGLVRREWGERDRRDDWGILQEIFGFDKLSRKLEIRDLAWPSQEFSLITGVTEDNRFFELVLSFLLETEDESTTLVTEFRWDHRGELTVEVTVEDDR